MTLLVFTACGQTVLTHTASTFRFKSAFVTFRANRLTISTGKLTRQWVWTGKGLATHSLRQEHTQKEWCSPTSNQAADWTLPNQDILPTGKLVRITARESDDEGFTTKHLDVVAEVNYPSTGITLRYIVWAYPGLDGLRTQLSVKTDRPISVNSNPIKGIPATSLSVLSATPEKDSTGAPANVLDGDVNTSWKTAVEPTRPDRPNFLVIALNKSQTITGLTLTQPQDYRKVGFVHHCIVYASSDTLNWGMPIGTAELTRAEYPQWIAVTPTKARYLKVVMPATNRVNYPDWQTVVAELTLYSAEFPYVKPVSLQADFLPLPSFSYMRRGMGYYGDTQFRNSLDLPFYKEETKTTAVNSSELWDWNNILSIESQTEGVCLVKESHKTVLHHGHETGEFSCTKQGVSVTGWGISTDELTGEFRECWANWCITYSGGEDERQLAVKTFDRARFPTLLPGHNDIIAGSWGYGVSPEAGWREKMNGGQEKNVLKALSVCQELGIETYLIDAGWTEDTLPTTTTNKFPAFRPHPDAYQHGWSTVKRWADSLHVKLALWAPVSIPAADLEWNQQQVPFTSWKLDFATLSTYQGRKIIEQKIRGFINQFHHKVGAQWDLTEISPRYGFYWAREYGVIWLENKEPNRHILYTPSTTLRDAWELAQYVNTNKFQLPVRNVKTVPSPSDAYLYNQPYAVAIGLVGIPMFFEKLDDYSPEDRRAIKGTLDDYKAERSLLHQSYLFPIGERPTNASFTGFQAVHPNGKQGHFLLFRELYAPSSTHELTIRFLKNKRLKLTNVRTKEIDYANVNAQGQLAFKINHPADFVFYRYEIVP
ncbi:discoidin domain-containing protein [Spirosoma arboris]|uniref:discoidin domain-containing protein n=1 Tax=Spirosoma arboris TaxID=2682092 RepID=UPI0018DC36B2|nr:discoidin domain-containing protein [Spirosoma arboris]